jgi:hypothetical protein
VSHTAIFRALRVLDLRDQIRLQPVHAARLGALGRIVERRLIALQRYELFVQLLQRALAETSADLARVAQALPIVVQAEQDRAEVLAIAVGRSVAADHEFLARMAFDLEPSAAASRDVQRIHALANAAFGAKLACTLEERAPVADDVVTQAHGPVRTRCFGAEHACGFECGAQDLFALEQRRAAQVVVPEVQQVEHVVEAVGVFAEAQ